MPDIEQPINEGQVAVSTRRHSRFQPVNLQQDILYQQEQYNLAMNRIEAAIDSELRARPEEIEPDLTQSASAQSAVSQLISWESPLLAREDAAVVSEQPVYRIDPITASGFWSQMGTGNRIQYNPGAIGMDQFNHVYHAGIPTNVNITPMPKVEEKKQLVHDRYITHNDTLNKVFREMADEHNNKIARNLMQKTYASEADDWIDYFNVAAEDKGKISYLNKSRYNSVKEKGVDMWTAKSRYMANPSNVVEKLFPEKYSDRDKEEFTNLYRHIARKECGERFEIQIVHGRTIKKYYHEKNYDKDAVRYTNSELANSCMCYAKCQSFFGLYTKNPKYIGMAVVLTPDEKVRARAIVWFPDGVKNTESPKYHDRIYAVNSELKRGMQAQLETMGFINISDRNDIAPKKEYRLKFDLDKGADEVSKFPYMDTMRYLKGNKISNYEEGWDCLDHTDGGPEYGENYGTCVECGVEHHTNDLIYVNCSNSRFYGDNLCSDHARYSNWLGGWFGIDEMQLLHDGLYTTHARAVQLYNGGWADMGDRSVLTDINGQRFLRGDENFRLIENIWYNIDSETYKTLINNNYATV